MKAFSNLISAILFLSIVALAPKIVQSSLADQKAKADLAEINHMMYGIFSVNAWKAQISGIILSEVQNLDLKSATQSLKATIENQLSAVIDKLNEQIREANKGSIGGRVKQVLIDLVVDIETVKKGVPGYADTLIAEATKPETEKLIKDLAAKRLRTYMNKTFVEQDMTLVNNILKRTETKTVKEANDKLHNEIEARKPGLETGSYVVIAVAVLLFAWVGYWRTAFGMTMLFATLMVLLGVGVSIPMIDLEAKIADMSFSLIGHRIGFENQILYFQSKSVLDVFWLMITHADIKMKFVGVLLVLFSVVFPVLKLASSMVFYYFEKTRSSRIIRFFAFKTGKWSMADVMVIAILMTYIGFNGIVETQFDKMKVLVPKDMTFITTNGTSMQMGYYIFLAYAILALVLASLLDTAKNER